MVQTGILSTRRPSVFLSLLCCLSGALAWAADPKEPSTSLDHKAFYRPELHIGSSHVPLEAILPELPNRPAWEGFLFQRGEDPRQPRSRIYIDPRSGAASNIVATFPLIPGTGAGNGLTLADLGRSLGRPVQKLDSPVVAEAARRFAESHAGILGIDVQQLGTARATQVTPDLWQISIPQEYGGIRVRDARLAASVSHGNLVLIGAETWGNVHLDATPRLKAEQALAAGFAYAGGRASEDVILREPRLEIAPLAPTEYQRGEGFAGPVGRGYGHRLVWTFVFQRPPDEARWEVMVDAVSGEVIAFQDINQYEQREVKGGVYPLTSTEICPDAARCGAMQSGWPMPFANTGFAAPNDFTNSAGIYDYTGGTATTTLSGRYIRIGDTCGAISESSATGTIDLGGVNGQHDCTSAGASAGDTSSSRSSFYELNRIAEQARGYLPGNTWLRSQLTSNVNLNATCNAFWNGVSVNFYRSGGGCRNTGEIAAVFDHEWGHGLDDNDANGVISNPGEGYADIAAIYRLQASCVGYGFWWTSDRGCGVTSDGTGYNGNEAQVGAAHCDLDCSGVRDADWDKHADHLPDTAEGFVCNSCTTGTGPCGRQVHCAAAPIRQAAWDLVARDLTAAPFGYDSQTSFILGNKLFYQGSGNIGTWYACSCEPVPAGQAGALASDGCGATNGYMQWITADDDNGNLNDGTPHMTAIHAAFDRHGIACAAPTPQNSGCGGGPTAAPTLSVTPGNSQNQLSWTAVTGASRYWVFRTEGHAGCDFGKTLIAETTGTAYTDTEVANGRTYFYNVVAAAASSACFGRASNCASGTPAAGPDFALACSPSSLSVPQGSSGASTCTVTSLAGFSAPVDLSCANLPAGVSCAYDPNPVTPPANGSVSSGLTVAVAGGTAAGTYAFQARGVSGSLTRSFDMTLQVTAVGGDFSLTATPPSQTVARGQSAIYTVTVTPAGGFGGTVTFSATGLPRGASASFDPPSVTGSGTSTLTITTRPSTTRGTFTLTISGTSGSLTRTTSVALTVTK
jgi:hypothetical protein